MLEPDPTEATAFLKRATAKEKDGDLDGAIEDFTRAIELDPENVGCYIRRGATKEAKGDSDGALGDYHRAMELDTEWGGPYYSRCGKFGEGDLPSAMAYYCRGVFKRRNKDLDGAINDFTKAIELSSEFARAYFERGQIKYRRGWNNCDSSEIHRAAADFEQAHRLDPENANGIGKEAWDLAGAAYRDCKQFHRLEGKESKKLDRKKRDQ